MKINFVSEHWIVLNVVHMFWNLETDLFQINGMNVTLNRDSEFKSPHMSLGSVRSVLERIASMGSVVLSLTKLLSPIVESFIKPRIEKRMSIFSETLQRWRINPDTTLIEVYTRLLNIEIPFFISIEEFLNDSIPSSHQWTTLQEEFLYQLYVQTVDMINKGKPHLDENRLEYIKKIPEWNSVVEFLNEECYLEVTDFEIMDFPNFKETKFNCFNYIETYRKQNLNAFLKNSEIELLLDLILKIAFFQQSDFIYEILHDGKQDDPFNRAVHSAFPPNMWEKTECFSFGDAVFLNASKSCVLTIDCLTKINRISKMLLNIIKLNYKLTDIYREIRREINQKHALVLWQMSSCMHNLVESAHLIVNTRFPLKIDDLDSITHLGHVLGNALDETETNLVNLCKKWTHVISLVEKFIIFQQTVKNLNVYDSYISIGESLVKEVNKISIQL